MKKYTISEFAQKIRAKYPGSYDDLSDKKLIELWLKKYPKDKEHVIEESKSGWGTYLIYVLAIWGGLSLINNKVTPIGFVNKINTELFGSNSNSTNKNNQEVIPNNQNTNSSDGINDEPIQNGETPENNVLTSIPVTDDALEIYNQSDFLKAIKPTENEKEWILAILSDPNPNPDRINGNSCSQSNYRCTYCSGFIPSRFYTLQWRLNDILNPSVLTGSSGLGYNYVARMYNEGENEVYEKALQQGYSIIEEVINGYKQGERYTCIREPITNGGQEFCSKECESNNRYSH
jgi:hypothetical protein